MDIVIIEIDTFTKVIYLYLAIKGKIYLITSYRKSSKENLTGDDLKVFRTLIKTIKNMEL